MAVGCAFIDKKESMQQSFALLAFACPPSEIGSGSDDLLSALGVSVTRASMSRAMHKILPLRLPWFYRVCREEIKSKTLLIWITLLQVATMNAPPSLL